MYFVYKLYIITSYYYNLTNQDESYEMATGHSNWFSLIFFFNSIM